jgi:hypothetical protein
MVFRFYYFCRTYQDIFQYSENADKQLNIIHHEEASI